VNFERLFYTKFGVIVIITRINGGFGNQMFQYAIGRSLSLKTGQAFKLDVGDYNDHPTLKHLAKYDLNVFNIEENFATKWEVRSFWNPITHRIENFFYHTKLRALTRRLLRICRQRALGFEPRVLEIKHSVFLVGYWQSERYFENFKDIIKQDFSFKNSPIGCNADLLEDIRQRNSICVHVRRADYVNLPDPSKTHGACSLDYYKRAASFVRKRVSEPQFYVFSDDPEWCKKQLKFLGPVKFVDHNTAEQRQEDLRLMVACKHFIIANSSMSWWGAWLGEYDSKIVIAPDQWFADETLDSTDIVPKEWIRL
jgi:hypothetical protein